MTADAAVKGIRRVDGKCSIGIIGAEPDPPYKRPPLSKDLWTKNKPVEDIACGTEAKGADFIGATRAVSLDPGRQQVSDDQGRVYRYRELLLATGGTPKRLPFGDDRVLYYRTLEDYRSLRGLTENGNRFAVLGGSFIGSEIAAALALNDKEVTMVFPEAAVGSRMLPPRLAQALNAYYAKRGVTLMQGCKPSAIETDGETRTVRLENGHTFSADGVVAGIGIAPDTRLAAEAGLKVNDGIAVDELLRAGHPHVFAAGDAASFYSPALERRLRVEHEDNALTMGETAGRNMAGEEKRYDHLPFFYSDLFDVGYEAVGATDASLEVVTELGAPEEKGCIFYMRDGRVRGVVFWNLFGKVDAGRELIAAPGPHTREGLSAWTKERLA